MLAVNKTHWRSNFLSYGFRFTTTDPTLMSWRQVPEQFLSDAAAKENDGQWTLRLPSTQSGAAPPPGSPTHMVSCGGGNRFCLGTYNLSNESWADAKPTAPTPLPPAPARTLCSRFALDWDVPGGDYNRNTSSRGRWRDCIADGNCPCQAACLADPHCDAWTVIRTENQAHKGEGNRCCLKSKRRYAPKSDPGSNWVHYCCCCCCCRCRCCCCRCRRCRCCCCATLLLLLLLLRHYRRGLLTSRGSRSHL